MDGIGHQETRSILDAPTDDCLFNLRLCDHKLSLECSRSKYPDTCSGLRGSPEAQPSRSIVHPGSRRDEPLDGLPVALWNTSERHRSWQWEYLCEVDDESGSTV